MQNTRLSDSHAPATTVACVHVSVRAVPVLLDLQQLKHVAGGLPYSTWGAAVTSEPPTLPYGVW